MPVIGEYPCCGGDLWINFEDGELDPGYYLQPCPHCGERIYHRVSRLDPESWTEPEWIEAGGKPATNPPSTR